MSGRLHPPQAMVIVSVIALVVTLLIASAIIFDQTKRINDPVKYAEQRCGGASSTVTLTPPQMAECVGKEEKKSTLTSIAPLLAAGIVVGGIGVAGLVIGLQEVDRYNTLIRKLKGEA